MAAMMSVCSSMLHLQQQPPAARQPAKRMWCVMSLAQSQTVGVLGAVPSAAVYGSHSIFYFSKGHLCLSKEGGIWPWHNGQSKSALAHCMRYSSWSIVHSYLTYKCPCKSYQFLPPLSPEKSFPYHQCLCLWNGMDTPIWYQYHWFQAKLFPAFCKWKIGYPLKSQNVVFGSSSAPVKNLKQFKCPTS